jgi:hypothetical protein
MTNKTYAFDNGLHSQMTDIEALIHLKISDLLNL